MDWSDWFGGPALWFRRPQTRRTAILVKANTVRIGIVSELQMSTGQGIVNAAKMAAEEINAGGGILGKKIELFIGDSELKPEKGVMAHEEACPGRQG